MGYLWRCRSVRRICFVMLLAGFCVVCFKMATISRKDSLVQLEVARSFLDDGPRSTVTFLSDITTPHEAVHSWSTEVMKDEAVAATRKMPPKESSRPRTIKVNKNPWAGVEESKVAKVNTRELSLKQRREFQQSQVEKFCKLHKELRYHTYQLLNRHLLVGNDSSSDVAFCFVPKAGCSTLKVLFFLAIDAIPKDRFVNWNRTVRDENRLERAIARHSYGNRTGREKMQILKTHRKYMMYRNPVNRVVSGYLSKINKYPLIGLEPDEPERNWLRLAIFQSTQPKRFRLWQPEDPIHIEFPDYVEYWIRTEGIHSDEHFQTSINLCSPCMVKYDYYGKFEDFANESLIFANVWHTDPDYTFRPPVEKLEQKATAPIEYYSQISKRQKIAILKILALDLALYYSLFPEERGSHKTIMGLDADVPIPTV